MQRVRVLVPALLGPIPESARVHLPSFPALEILLARGRALAVAANDTEALIAAQFVEPAETPSVPAGALGLYGDRGEAGTDYWLHADPVRLEADRDSVMLFVDETHLTREEADALVAAFNAHFADDGLHLEAPAPDRWYLRWENAIDVKTAPTDRVVGRYYDAFLPSGENGRRLAAILNEAQMLLFTHPVNERRRERGLPMVNGVWLWGGGRLPAPAPEAAVWERIEGDHPSLRGWARLHDRTVEPTVSLPIAATGDGPWLIFVDGPRRALLGGNLSAWEGELAALERDVAAPLLDAVRRGVVSLEILTEGVGWQLGRGELRRFWRRRRPFEQWIRR